MRFEKYQGLGNDFIVVDGRAIEPLTPARVRALCDRRFGIGADGVLVVEPGAAAPWRMTVHNADGSLAEMCGNGLRCVVRWLRHHHPELPSAFDIETGAGALSVRDGSAGVTVQMGATTDHGPLTLTVGERAVSGRRLSLGNPHFVMFGAWSDAEFAALGPALCAHGAFSEGANISFAEVIDPRTIRLRVWERGSGPTLACGTGACATAAAGWIEGRFERGQAIRISLPGGDLQIAGSPKAVEMTGDAERVFRGVWQPSAAARR